MTESNVIVMVAGAILSLAFGYLPGLRPWFEALDGIRKAQVMGILLILAAVLVFLLACYTPYQWATCSGEGAWQLVELLFAALVANQATYVLVVRPTRSYAEQL